LLLGILFLLSIGLNSIYAEYTIEWSIPFSVYRLIYNFTVTSDTPEAYVHVVIPESIIDQYLQYWQNKGINPFNYRDLLAPRVYYVKVIPPSFPGDPYILAYYFVQNNITCFSIYNNYCNNFTVYLTNVPAGTHHIVVYMPAFVWEDFEDNSLYARVSEVGQCIDNEWCVEIAKDYRFAEIRPGGRDPTPSKYLHLHVDDTSAIVLSKVINISVTRHTPIILEFDVWGSLGAFGLVIEYTLEDGTIVYFRYGNKDIPGISSCSYIPLPGGGRYRFEALMDLWKGCGIPAGRVSKINKIYLVYWGIYHGGQDMCIDNIKLAPGFLYT
jgi:hypothetical protein